MAAGANSLLCGVLVCLGGCTARAALRPERLLVVDVDADPLGLGGHPGALFEIDPATRQARLVASTRDFTDPVDVIGESDGSLLVLDLCGLGGEGKLLRLAADGKTIARIALPPSLVDPTAMARAPDGSLWICDRGVAFAGATPGPGALFRVAPDFTQVDVITSGSPLAAPSDLCFVGDRLFLLDADACRGALADLSEGALFECTPRTYRRGDNPPTKPALVAQLHLVSPLSLATMTSGAEDSFLITDVNADPGNARRLNGAVYRLDLQPAASVSLFVQDPAWRDPSSGTPWHGQLLVVDGSADPLALGDDPVGIGFSGKGRGGVYAVDLATRAVKLFCATPDFVNPARLRVVP